jgi:alkylation response protein AidB-like acyl-CoA dehydrogenase
MAAAAAFTTHAQLPEEHVMLYEMCRKFADEELAPYARKWDQEHSFPTAIPQLVRRRSSESVYCTTTLPLTIILVGTRSHGY